MDAPWGEGEKRFPAVVVKVEEGGEKLTLKYYGYAETEVGVLGSRGRSGGAGVVEAERYFNERVLSK